METINTNIILLGFMGTGKTRVGVMLTEKLGMTFLDMDEVIEEREGKSIPRIFEEDGEPHFRSLERKLVRELSVKSGLVIGAGGGVVLNPDNAADFGRNGLVICLSAAPETILERVADDTNRPLLAEGDKMEKIQSLLKSRQPFYDSIRHQIDTTNLTVEQVVDRIIGLYRKNTPAQ